MPEIQLVHLIYIVSLLAASLAAFGVGGLVPGVIVLHDVKEVWGAGQQQVRNIWTNVAVYHLNLWMHTLVELWAWDKKHEELCDRTDSPWDDVDRRPSHANRRKALRRSIMRNELSAVTVAWRLPRKIITLAEHLMNLAS